MVGHQGEGRQTGLRSGSSQLSFLDSSLMMLYQTKSSLINLNFFDLFAQFALF
jgi:hypothetical protein